MKSSSSRKKKRILVLIVSAAWMASRAIAQLPDLENRLRDLSSPDLTSRSKGFDALLRPFMNNGRSAYDIGISNLLRAYPDQAERIKIALIAALEREGAYREETEKKGEQLSETFTEHWFGLSLAVSALRDPRSIKGLLAGQGPSGDAMSHFTDLCPSAVDAIVEKSQSPSQYWRGTLLVNNRALAVALLGQCLTRVSAMRSAPQAFDKARNALLAALEDTDPGVRTTAANSLFALHSDPEVRARLELLAGTDPPHN